MAAACLGDRKLTMREIVLDIETTGFYPENGDRIVEIAALELVNHLPSKQYYQRYLNPERDMPEDAFKVHGLSQEFLADQPLFAHEAQAFLDFVADSPLVIHNAGFDMKFLNAELAWTNRPPLSSSQVIDTLQIARKRFPGAPASLDALCRRFGVDLSVRTSHGALVDCRLLAAVYLELIGGRQPGFTLDAGAASSVGTSEAKLGSDGAADVLVPLVPTRMAGRPPRPHMPSEIERARHSVLVKQKIKNPIWLQRKATNPHDG